MHPLTLTQLSLKSELDLQAFERAAQPWRGRRFSSLSASSSRPRAEPDVINARAAAPSRPAPSRHPIKAPAPSRTIGNARPASSSGTPHSAPFLSKKSPSTARSHGSGRGASLIVFFPAPAS
jgi:hypothetical protein